MVETAQPLVSVVIPTIRFDFFTHQAISSIFFQSYENWEVILVLDGALESEVPQYLMEHPKIQVVIHKNRLGTPVSLNDGVAASQGDFIARLDADDIAHPERLQKQVKFLTENAEVGCVGTNGVLVSAKGERIGDLSQRSTHLDIRPLLLTRNILTHSSVMFRRSIFDETGGYNPKMIRMQDYDLFLRMSQTAQIAYLGETLCAYRTHDGQHSKKTSPFKAYTWEILIQRLKLANCLSRSIPLQALKNAQWYAAQVFRHTGIRKPGYLLRATKQARETVKLPWLNPQVPIPHLDD